MTERLTQSCKLPAGALKVRPNTQTTQPSLRESTDRSRPPRHVGFFTTMSFLQLFLCLHFVSPILVDVEIYHLSFSAKLAVPNITSLRKSFLDISQLPSIHCVAQNFDIKLIFSACNYNESTQKL